MSVVVGIVVLFTIVPLWAAIDAASTPGWAFERAGTSKALWIILPIVGLVACGFVGIGGGIIWFASTRPKVRAAMAGSYPPGPPAAPGPAGFGVASAVPPPLPLAPVAPAGWYPDPAGGHELRYFDGTVWTSHVSDRGAPSQDAL